LRKGHRVQNGPDQEAEAETAPNAGRGASQPARPRTNSTNVATGTPVGPAGSVTRSLSLYAVPAMSRCTHGYPSANSFRKSAAVIVPAGRPPEFLMSATSDLMSGLKSSHIGNGQPGSDARFPAASTSSMSVSSLPITP